MRKLKLYIESSTWNFVFADDAPEKRDVTKEFFNLVRKGFYEIYISTTVLDEINEAPASKKDQLIALIKECNPVEFKITEEAKNLAEIYMERKIVPEKKPRDAVHVGVATVNELDALITWNYRHLANLRKAELFHGVNLERGYFKKLEIITPMEVVTDEVR